MGAERSLLLPDAYPVYFARVSRSGRVRHAIRIPEANQDFATCLEVPLKAGADWPAVTRCGPARNSLTGNQPLPWPFPDPQSRSLRGARNSLAQTEDYTTSQKRRKPPIPLPSGLPPASSSPAPSVTASIRRRNRTWGRLQSGPSFCQSPDAEPRAESEPSGPPSAECGRHSPA